MGFALELQDSWNIQKPRSVTAINSKTDRVDSMITLVGVEETSKK